MDFTADRGARKTRWRGISKSPKFKIKWRVTTVIWSPIWRTHSPRWRSGSPSQLTVIRDTREYVLELRLVNRKWSYYNIVVVTDRYFQILSISPVMQRMIYWARPNSDRDRSSRAYLNMAVVLFQISKFENSSLNSSIKSVLKKRLYLGRCWRDAQRITVVHSVRYQTGVFILHADADTDMTRRRIVTTNTRSVATCRRRENAREFAQKKKHHDDYAYCSYMN